MSLCSYIATAAPPIRRRFVGGSDARFIRSGEEVALIRLWREQNVQMKSQRSLGVSTGNPRDSCAHGAKSPTGQAQFLRPFRSQYSRASYRQRQTAAILTTFMICYSEFRESVLHSAAKTLRLLFGTHFRSRRSSPGFPRSDRPRYS